MIVLTYTHIHEKHMQKKRIHKLRPSSGKNECTSKILGVL